MTYNVFGLPLNLAVSVYLGENLDSGGHQLWLRISGSESDDNCCCWSVSEAWYKDQTVTVLELPELICHQLLHCLAANTSSIPSSLQHAADHFTVRRAVFSGKVAESEMDQGKVREM